MATKRWPRVWLPKIADVALWMESEVSVHPVQRSGMERGMEIGDGAFGDKGEM